MHNTNDPQKSLVDCPIQFPLNTPNDDVTPPFCGDDLCNPKDELNKRVPDTADLNWLKDEGFQKEGLGARNDCDPMKTGKIRNDPNRTSYETIYRYSKSLTGTNEAMLDLFSDIEVIDEDGKAHKIPIIFGTQEKAVAVIVSDNVRKDKTLVVDRIRLPMLSINAGEISYDTNRYTYHKAIDYLTGLREDGKPGFTINEKGLERSSVFGRTRGIPVNIGYTLNAWTLYVEDMNQIVEQVLSKFSQLAYIKVRGVHWEIPVKLESIANNIENEPGDQAIRVVKYQFGMTTSTYIPQPLVRKKAVLKTTVDFLNGTSDSEVQNLISKLEQSVRELEC